MTSEHFYFPPFHPGCRCTVVAIRDVNAYVQQEIDGVEPDAAHNLPDLSKTIDTYGVDADGRLVRTAPATMAPSDFLGFESVEAAEEYYASRLPGLGLELGGVEENVALEVLNQFERLRLEHPAVASRLEGIAFEAGTAEQGTLNALSWAYDDGSRLVFNTKYFRSSEALKDVFERNLAEGVFVSTTASPIAQTVTHEAAHLLYASLSAEQKAALAKIFEGGAGYRLSLVAQQDVNEMFAEAFTAMRHGGRLSEETAAIQKILARKPAKVAPAVSSGVHNLPTGAKFDLAAFERGLPKGKTEWEVEQASLKVLEDGWLDKITPKQAKAIQNYKKGPKQYTAMADYLRGNVGSSLLPKEEIREMVANLDSLYTKKTTENLVVWRGTSTEVATRYYFKTDNLDSIVGKTYVPDTSFWSTALSRRYAEQWAAWEEWEEMDSFSDGQRPLLFKILLPKGTKSAVAIENAGRKYGATIMGEGNEVVIKRNAKYRVIASEADAEGRRIITLLLEEDTATAGAEATATAASGKPPKVAAPPKTPQTEVAISSSKGVEYQLGEFREAIYHTHIEDFTFSNAAGTYQNWRDNLMKVEEKAITQYKDGKFDTVNAKMRSGAKRAADEIKFADRMDKLFRAPMPESVVVWRTQKNPKYFFDVFGDNPAASIGKTAVLDKGVMSSTFMKKTADTFGKTGAVQYKILVPKGSTNALYVDAANIDVKYKQEQEVLFKAKSKFKLVAYDEKTRTATLLLDEPVKAIGQQKPPVVTPLVVKPEPKPASTPKPVPVKPVAERPAPDKFNFDKATLPSAKKYFEQKYPHVQFDFQGAKSHGIDDRVVIECLKGLDTAARLNANTFSKISKIVFRDIGDSYANVTTDFPPYVMNIGISRKTISDYINSYEKGYKNWFSAFDSKHSLIEHIVVHEFGHMVHASLENGRKFYSLVGDVMNDDKIIFEISRRLHQEWKVISRYAGTNAKEAFAEAYSGYYLNSDAPELLKRCFGFLENLEKSSRKTYSRDDLVAANKKIATDGKLRAKLLAESEKVKAEIMSAIDKIFEK